MTLQEENEKLRGLLNECRPILEENGYWTFSEAIEITLSQQAEPCEFHDSDQVACQQYSGQVPCEPATTQDELMPRNQAIAEAFRAGVEWQRNRPAQDEREAFQQWWDQHGTSLVDYEKALMGWAARAK